MKSLILISALIFLSACGKENSDSTTPPPPTVPARKPAPSPGKTGATVPSPGNPVNPDVPTNPVTPPAPVVPAPVIPVKASPAVLDNVVWNCFNSVTNRTVQVNGYTTDVGAKFFLRPHGEAPIELTSSDYYGTGYTDAPQRFCAKPAGILDLAAYVLEVKGSFAEGKRGAQPLATLTRYRFMGSELNCSRKPDVVEYDIKDGLTCTLGANAFINPEKPLAKGIEIQDFGNGDYRTDKYVIRNVKRDILGNTYILTGKTLVIRLDKQLKNDASFGQSGVMSVSIPRETLNDQIDKIIDIAPEAGGGFMALVQMERSGDVAAIHFAANGTMAKHILVNGFVILKTGYQPNTRFIDGSIFMDGLVVFAQFDQELMTVRNGIVSSFKERINQPVRKIFQTVRTTLGGVFVTWTDSTDTAKVTRIKADGSAGFTISPSVEAKATIYEGQLLNAVAANDGGFFFVFVASDYYRNKTLKIVRFNFDGVKNVNYDFSFTQPTSNTIGNLFFENVAKSAFVFGDGSLGLPFYYNAKATESTQLGMYIVSPFGKLASTLKGSIGQDKNFSTYNHQPWAVAHENGSLYTLGLYTDRDVANDRSRLIMVQVSP